MLPLQRVTIEMQAVDGGSTRIRETEALKRKFFPVREANGNENG